MKKFAGDIEWDRQDFCHFGPFFSLLSPLPPLIIPKIKILKKKLKCTLSEDHMTILYPFSPLTPWKIKILKMEKKPWRYYHFTHVYQKWQSYDAWFLRYGAWQTDFFAILDHFLHFFSPNNPKNQTFEKMKKTPGDIIILHTCTINENHMMYGSWDMECNRLNFLSLWTVFCIFLP